MKKAATLFLLIISLYSIAQNKSLRTFPDLENKLDTHFPIEKFKDQNGKNYSADYLKGKITLLNFWFTTCEPCLKEIPDLVKLKKSVGNKINFMGITPDTEEKVTQFLLKHDFDFQQVTNAGQQLKELFVVQRYPMTFIVDKNGNIREIMGIISEEKFDSIKKRFDEY
ncbi:TlpA disulfide reductase family protein [Chryseobacterium sp. ISL-6]|uniref:TlpA family protein disulfide reductase n=1 Tax=Chryseobacterium sp. ISL-6 TaxID=2819143 RepID=UPI001BE6CB7C|nr:TlpA disulfide reductase family protein [Chryseobacterium sp. ISL-6]MBT2620415.1 TlpA family protein disulfide reductase [Chryseobacterium sp. ISL-6]